MKKLVVTFFVIAGLSAAASAQYMVNNLRYGIRPKYKRPIQKETLEKANTLQDIIPDYPVNWIFGYESVEILVNGHGRALRGVGNDALLSADQKSVLQKAALADDVEINVHYRSQNTVTRAPENGGMHTVFTVVPQTEAVFTGGEAALERYLGSKGIEEISARIPAGFKQVRIGFVVDERGNITEVKLAQSCGNGKVDRLLLEAIRNMPPWQPALNGQGRAVSQEFEFTAGSLSSEGC